jgi:hypothetical protein
VVDSLAKLGKQEDDSLAKLGKQVCDSLAKLGKLVVMDTLAVLVNREDCKVLDLEGSKPDEVLCRVSVVANRCLELGNRLVAATGSILEEYCCCSMDFRFSKVTG